MDLFRGLHDAARDAARRPTGQSTASDGGKATCAAAGGSVGTPAPTAGAGEQQRPLEAVLRGFKDLRAVLQPPPAPGSPTRGGAVRKPQGAGGSTGNVHKGSKTGSTAAQATAAAKPFLAAWTSYRASNPRLRDPKALPVLVRRGVPDELRHEVWAHCLGVEASAAAAAVAEALGAAAAAAEANAQGDGNMRSSRPEITPEELSRQGTPRETALEPQEVLTTKSPAVDAQDVLEDEAEPEEGNVPAPHLESTCTEEAPVEVEESALKVVEAQAPAPPEELREKPSSRQDSEGSPRLVPVQMVGGIGVLARRIDDLIEADVLRTFPNNPTFQQAGGPDQLRRILRTLAAGDPELGYCQSMNFLAATFILVLGDESYAHLAVRQLLVKLSTRCWYTDGMKQLRADTAVLEDLVRERLPNVYALLRSHRFDFLFVSSKWFLCLFATTLEGEALRRVWDVILCDGIEAVFRVALAMMAQGTAAILRTKSHDDLIFLFQDWQLESTPEQLLESAYDPALVGPVSRAELAQRRKQAAMRVSSADTRDNMRNNKFWRGGVRPASLAR